MAFVVARRFLELRAEPSRLPVTPEHRCRCLDRRCRRLDRLVLSSLWTYGTRHDSG